MDDISAGDISSSDRRLESPEAESVLLWRGRAEFADDQSAKYGICTMDYAELQERIRKWQQFSTAMDLVLSSTQTAKE